MGGNPLYQCACMRENHTAKTEANMGGSAQRTTARKASAETITQQKGTMNQKQNIPKDGRGRKPLTDWDTFPRGACIEASPATAHRLNKRYPRRRFVSRGNGKQVCREW